MKTKIVSLALVFVMLMSLAISLTGCSANNPFTKGAKLEQSIISDKENTVGSTSKTGWELSLPKDTFEENVTLTMNVLSSADSKSYESSDFTFLGTPVELKLSNKENVRLNEPVKVTLKLPKDQLKQMAAEELFYGYYYNGSWEYYLPDNIDMQEGTATFYIYHFSFLGFGKPTEKKQIETFAKTTATKEWNRSQKTEEFTTATSKQFDELFKSMGVTSKSARNQLAADVISYLEDKYIDSSGVAPIDALAQMANSASQGDDGMQAYKDKLLEFTGKALIATLERDPSSFSSSVNIIGNLASAAGAIAGGDKKGALESVANMLKGAVPQAVLADAALNYVKSKMEDTIEYWTASELEKAYQIYSTGNGGKYGYEDGLKGDFETIFTLLGGIDRQMNIKIIKQYCEKRNIDENILTEEGKNQIIAQAKSALKKNFDKRIVSETEIKKLQAKEESFIEQLKKEGLFSASNYQKYFGIDKNIRNYNINDRLDRLYTIRKNVLSMMDKDMAASINDEFLAKAIAQWIYWNEKGDIKGFYNYMHEMGYIKETMPNVKDAGEGYWSLASSDVVERTLNKNYSGSIAQGSGQIKIVSESSGDVFSASMNWTSPGSEYNAGDIVELTISVKVDEYSWHGKNDGYIHMGLNYVGAHISSSIDVPELKGGSATRAAISLKDENGEYSAKVSTDNGKTVVASTTLKVSAAFPSGSEEGDLRTVYVDCDSGVARYNYVWTK